MILEFSVNNQKLTALTKRPLIADSENYFKAHFIFSKDWDGLSRIVYFKRYYDSTHDYYFDYTLDSTNTVTIPWEVLQDAGTFTVGCYGQTSSSGGTDETVITCNLVEVYLAPSCLVEGQLPSTPSEGVIGQAYAKIATVYNNLANITPVGQNIQAVINVNTNLTAIQTVSSNATNINTVASNITGVNSVSTNMAAVNGVYGNISAITSVNSNATNINSVAGDLANINACANDLTNIDAAPTYAATASTKASEASASATSAAGSASTATTKASEAATSASTATTKASEASGSATSAGNSATAAASSASAASTSETNAATSATNAAASESNALSYKNDTSQYKADTLAIKNQAQAIKDSIVAPSIDSATNHWFVNGTDTGVSATGPQGAKGDKGDDGDAGTAATISVGTVTTGAAGSSVVITNVGTTSAAVFNFTIPKGDKGDAGASSWADITGKPTSVSGFGITDAYTKTETDTLLDAKQATLSTSQLNAVNSGITSSKVSTYDGYASTISSHTSNVNNPHSVTKSQVGLGNVDNTADTDKPISTATQTALDAKQATLVSGTNIKTINSTSLLGSGDVSIASGFTGSVVWCAYTASTIPSGYLLCNGAAVSRTTYSALFAVIGTTYGTGDGSTTFNLPDLADKFIEGSTTAGTSKSAGLPNISGNIYMMLTYFGFSIDTDGAFSKSAYSDIGDVASGGVTRDGVQVNFSASRSSSIYGNSTTVQPPAITMLPLIKY